jgi:hypothetical protein
MPRGATVERERQYDGLVDEFKNEGRYEGREEEVAARIVNKQRAEFGETQAAKEADRRGESPDRHLPLRDYDGMTVEEVTAKMDDLSSAECRQIRTYEHKHRNRTTLIEELDRRIESSR